MLFCSDLLPSDISCAKDTKDLMAACCVGQSWSRSPPVPSQPCSRARQRSVQDPDLLVFPSPPPSIVRTRPCLSVASSSRSPDRCPTLPFSYGANRVHPPSLVRGKRGVREGREEDDRTRARRRGAQVAGVRRVRRGGRGLLGRAQGASEGQKACCPAVARAWSKPSLPSSKLTLSLWSAGASDKAVGFRVKEQRAHSGRASRDAGGPFCQVESSGGVGVGACTVNYTSSLSFK